MNKLVVLGSVNADHVLQVPNFPRPGETITGMNYQVLPGGKGANQAVAAARLGADVGFIACVGDDDFGKNIINSFQHDGMNTQGITVANNTPTGIAMIQVSATGENSICLSPEANIQLTQETISRYKNQIHNAEYLLLQLETPLAGIEYAIKEAKIAKQTTKVILNPAPAQPLSDAVLSQVDIITPNETEAEVLTGIKVTDQKSAQSAADALHSKGIATVMITLGSKGVWISQIDIHHRNDHSSTQSNGQLVAGFKVEAVDTTAAGDTFNGALVTALIEGLDMASAIQFSHAAAALSVTKLGAQTSIPTREETDAFLCKMTQK